MSAFPSRILVCTLLSAGVLTAAASACAQPDSTKLKALYDEGRAAIINGEWDAAYKALSKLWAQQKSGRVAGLLGQAESQLGNCPDAIEHLTFALGDLPPDRPADAGARLTSWIDECKRKVATLHLDVQPETATVLINGKPLGTAKELGKDVYADAGKIQVLLTQDGYESARLALEVRAGENGDVKVALEPKRGALSHDVDATEQPPLTPSTGTGNNPGAHTSSSTTPWLVGGALTAVTVASAGTSFVLRGKANDHADQYHRLQGSLTANECSGSSLSAACKSLRDAASTQRSEATWSNVTLVVAGVAAVATVGYVVYELTSSSKTSASVRASVEVGSAGGGIFLSGSF